MAHTPNPIYAPPVAATEQVSPENISGTYGPFRKNGTLKNLLVSLLVLDAMLIIFNDGVINFMDMRQYESADYLVSETSSQLDSIVLYSAWGKMALSIILIIVFAIWINRSCKNAWLLDPPRMTITPAWSVGYYFIPILLLWKPFVAMKQIRSASYGKDHALKAVLPLWWTLWIISMLIDNVSTRMLQAPETVDDYLTGCKLVLVATPINVILNYLAIALVTGITLAQQRRLINWHQ